MRKARQTLNSHRFKENPAERIFVEEWRRLIGLVNGVNDVGRNRQLEAILSPNQPQMEIINDRDEQVAETVIQWLGSPVGMNFLGDVIKRSPELRQLLLADCKI